MGVRVGGFGEGKGGGGDGDFDCGDGRSGRDGSGECCWRARASVFASILVWPLMPALPLPNMLVFSLVLISASDMVDGGACLARFVTKASKC
eukprot:5422876-Pleurochrysis_carterae.AAC.1